MLVPPRQPATSMTGGGSVFLPPVPVPRRPRGISKAAKPGVSLDNKYTFVRGRKQPAHSRHCGLVYGVAAAPHSGTSTAWVSGVFILTVSVLPCLFLFCFVWLLAGLLGPAGCPASRGPKILLCGCCLLACIWIALTLAPALALATAPATDTIGMKKPTKTAAKKVRLCSS